MGGIIGMFPISNAGGGEPGCEMNWRQIDLNLLVVFDPVMQERNATRAAERLNMSQPAALAAYRFADMNLTAQPATMTTLATAIRAKRRRLRSQVHVSKA